MTQRFQIDPRRNHHHKRTVFIFIIPERDDFHAAGQVIFETVVKNKIPGQTHIAELHGHRIMIISLFIDRGGCLKSGDANIFDWTGRFQFQVHGNRIFHLGVGGPETFPGFVRAAIFQGIEVAADTGIHFQRLVVKKPYSGLTIGGHRINLERKGVKFVLFSQTGIIPLAFFVFVDLSGFLLFQHFPMDFTLTSIDGHLREAGTFGQGEAVHGFQIFGIGVEKRLLHLGHGKTIIDHHIDMVIHDLDGLMAGSHRRQNSGGMSCAGGQSDGCNKYD